VKCSADKGVRAKQYRIIKKLCFSRYYLCQRPCDSNQIPDLPWLFWARKDYSNHRETKICSWGK